MGSPAGARRLLYRSTRLLRAAFQHLHQQQQRADVFCDAVLQAEGGTVVAHCCVLSVCSPFFREQLHQELPPRGKRVVLELGGLKIGVLRTLVRFLYTAELEATQDEVQEVLAAARLLRVTELESLQLQAGRLVRLGPSRQLNRSCLGPAPNGSPAAADDRAERGGRASRPGSTGGSPQGQSGFPGGAQPSPVGRVKLRKVESRGCWEVVRDRQPPAAAAVPRGEGTEAERPLDAGALGQASRRHSRRQSPQAASRKQGCGQVVPPADPKEEEVDVGTVEPCLPPGTVCVWPCPSSESDEEVDILT
ncbi:BTB/POZ domain-containing protein 18 [Dryobates pubescens]|uniref:BTB/POZ domain-containing protein 18 n=1 Tax=Dryobates pubescens TaxID=118200 RepID=UPI0023B92656|nr:BTB/POZ domain-containing protein 18 [Dryobates pubescens]